jgi:hypothetical protein
MPLKVQDEGGGKDYFVFFVFGVCLSVHGLLRKTVCVFSSATCSLHLSSSRFFRRTAWLAYILVGSHGARLALCWSHCLVDDMFGW